MTGERASIAASGGKTGKAPLMTNGGEAGKAPLMTNGRDAGKALIALSGGVDSAVAALLTIGAGYECAAVTLDLYGAGTNNEALAYAIGNSDAGCAAEIASLLGIPFEVLDLRKAFDDEVVKPFIASYLGGATPNPCVECNRRIKFGHLIDYALKNGYGLVSTGHYARIDRSSGKGRVLLKKGIDAGKDQSYML
jgi:tRNA-specific 2-thiouridylase